MFVQGMVLTLCFFALPVPVRAQNDLATLSGTVKDTKGYLLPNTKVTIVNTSTNDRGRVWGPARRHLPGFTG